MNNQANKKIYKQFLLKGIGLTILVTFLLINLNSCAANYKHRRHKAIPCPCETKR
jgi:hypothetical protein